MTTVANRLLRCTLSVVAILAVAAARYWTDRGAPQTPLRKATIDEGSPRAQKPAPEFSLNTLDGRRVELASLRGKVVLLNFWATWCAPCRVEMPWLADFYNRYRVQGLEVIGVSVDDDDSDKVAAFVRTRHVNYTMLLKDTAVSDAYGGLRFLPQTLFIGRDGGIIKQTYGVRSKDEFESDIRQAKR